MPPEDENKPTADAAADPATQQAADPTQQGNDQADPAQAKPAETSGALASASIDGTAQQGSTDGGTTAASAEAAKAGAVAAEAKAAEVKAAEPVAGDNGEHQPAKPLPLAAVADVSAAQVPNNGDEVKVDLPLPSIDEVKDHLKDRVLPQAAKFVAVLAADVRRAEVAGNKDLHALLSRIHAVYSDFVQGIVSHL